MILQSVSMYLLQIAEFSGRLHPLLVHLPIGILLLGILLHWLSLRPACSNLLPAVKITLLLGAVGALLSCISGWLLAAGGDYEGAALERHRWMGVSVAVASFGYYFLFITPSGFKGLFSGKLALSLILAVLLSLTGHLGGTLTHGEEYLAMAWNANETRKPEKKLITDVQQAMVYEDIIAPVLAQKCYSCHGSSKQRGKLRLDAYNMIVKGGEEGNTLVAGNAEASNLFARLVLDAADKKRMPPKGKTQLTENEITLIHWWIQSGAVSGKQVNSLEQPEEIIPVLTALESKGEAVPAVTDIPEDPVEKAPEEAIDRLKATGANVIPVSGSSNYLSVNFLSLRSVTDKEMALLEPLARHIVWLKAGGTSITDEALSVIGKLPVLIRLSINNTQISDNGLASLQQLQHLRYLNLVGTPVSAAGVQALKGLSRLQSMYLYKTNISFPEEMSGLQEAFPGIHIDSGGYIVPVLPTDTMIVTRAR